MNDILQGLELGSSRQATFHDLIWLRGKLAELKPTLGAATTQGELRNQRAPSGTAVMGRPSTVNGLQPMTPQIKSAMDAALAEGHSRAEVEAFIRKKYNVDPGSSMAPDVPDPSMRATDR